MEKIVNLELVSIERFVKICEFLGVEPDTDVTIFEFSTLEEYSRITGMPYHIGAIYQDGIIYTQPFETLRRKGCLEDVFIHELLHHVLEKYFDLPEWVEEGMILLLLGVKPEEVYGYHRDCLLRIMKVVRYEEIPDFVDRYRRSSVEHR
ncbi:MAG: Uncharacterized protein XD57_1167 [Thermotoga petrophila]|uniref:Uncharacterized protein n=1 Tax=Thermotoga petrophila TaxID=93929 RepID=A0A117L2P2_9THEM|nr:MAG: Uncharacterized protein XD57_1167 [Thermotoga petrophila]MDK2785649.1 hypothetical protein [Thermotoga sp.]